MKKLLLLFFLVFNTAMLFSQTRFGFKFGYHLSNMVYVTNEPNQHTSTSKSFHATVLAEIPLIWNLYLQPAISLLQKGATVANGNSSLEINPVYVEVPLNLLSKIEIGNGKAFFGGGAYAAIGVAGSVITNQYINGRLQGHPINYGSDAQRNDLKKFDYGINFLTGYEFNKNISLGIGYGIGMANIWPPSSGSIKNRLLSVSIGILL